MKHLLFFTLFASLYTSAFAQQEFRTWTSKDGKTVEARYVSYIGGVVRLQTKSGRAVGVRPNQLTPGDQDFLKTLIQSSSPPTARPPTNALPSKPVRRTRPTIENLKEKIQIGPIYFNVTQSDHFRILSTGRNGRSYAENAEMVYQAAATILPELDTTFGQGESSRHMVSILIEDSSDYNGFIDYYVKDLQARGQHQAAEQATAVAGRVGQMGISLNASDEDTAGTGFRNVALFSPGGSRNGKEDEDPFRTHVFAKQILNGHGEGKVNWPFWLANGFGYRMEIELCGETRTHMIDYSKFQSAAGGGDGEIVTSQSFADGKKWISNLKKLMRSTKGKKGDVNEVLASSVANLTPERCGYMFALCHYMLSDSAMQEKYAHMIENARTSGQSPQEASVRTFEQEGSLEAFQENWHDYMKGSRFR